MHISAALQRSCRVFAESKFIVDQDSQTFVTYGVAWKLTKLHSEWIGKLLKETVRVEILLSRTKNIVVAYLAQNSQTLLFSMLSCIVSEYTNYRTDGTIRMLPVMLNFRWSANEIAKALLAHAKNDDEESFTLLLCDKGLERKAKEAATIISSKESYHTVHTRILPHISAIETKSIPNRFTFSVPIIDGDDDYFEATDAIILFTSGSTGGPKGVRLSHSALCSQALAKLLPPCSYCSSTRMVASTVPFFHVGGLSSTLAIILAGGCLVFPFTFKNTNSHHQHKVFQPEAILKSILSPQNEQGFVHLMQTNTLVLVPAMLFSLLSEIHKVFEKNTLLGLDKDTKSTNNYDRIFEHVELILIGGQGISSEQLLKVCNVFPNARIVQTYACTEAASSITFAQLYPKEKLIIHSSKNLFKNQSPSTYVGDFVGIPPPHVQVAICRRLENSNKTNGEIKFLPSFQAGLIATNGPHVMNGYWNRSLLNEYNGKPNKDTKILKRNRWFITNDLGYLDDNNRLFFVGRANDVIRTGGETVHAVEVEKIIRLDSDIIDCAVVALPDEKFGEVVAAAITVKEYRLMKYLDSQEDTELGLVKHIRRHCTHFQLAGYKQPKKAFIIYGSIPRNTSGKVLKMQVKQLLMNRIPLDSNEGIISCKSKL